MKTPFKIALSFVLVAFCLSCSTDDDTTPAPDPVEAEEPVEAVEPVEVNFSEDKSLSEKSTSNEVLIEFSKPALESGRIVVRVDGNSTNYFSTVPAMVNNEIEIQVAAGAESAGFNIVPVDNGEINGHKALTFRIKSVTTGFEVGSIHDVLVELLDDELVGKPKSWETRAGIWRIKKTFEYDTEGKVSKVNWESENPDYSSGTDTYHYNENNEITRINQSATSDKYFYWEDGRIIRTEEIEQGIKQRYQEYTYTPSGSIHSVTFHNRNLSGGYASSTQVHEYFPDGNIKKSVWYSTTDVNGYIYSRRTYDAYVNKENPFPMVDLVPTVKLQTKLPGYVLIQENGMDLSYNLLYEYDVEGRVIRRNISGETTTYAYY